MDQDSVPFDESHPKALAIYCSDGRFTQPVEQLLAVIGHERLDTLTLPGGPGLLNWLNNGFVDFDAMSRATTFLVRGHAIEHVILIAHHGCGHYRSRYTGASPEEIRAAQVIDLRAAAKHVLDRHPEVEVRMFYARPQGGRVRFYEVKPE